MMRVLFITGEFPPMQGGVGDCTSEIAKGLAALGCEVRVLTSTKAGAPDAARSTVMPVIGRWDWSSLPAIARAVHEFTPHVVHIQYQTGAFGMHPAINFLPRYLHPRTGDEGRAPRRGLQPRQYVVATFHDLRVPYLFPKAGPVRNWVTQALARSSDADIATNDEDYLKLETWKLRRLSLIPIGSNVAALPPLKYDRAAWRAHLGLAENETLLCYFGFLNESKGGETLVRALAQVPGAKLLMIGGQVGASDLTNMSYLAHVKALIAELGVADRVLWTDYASQEIVAANFFAADLCVLPYRDGASFRRGTLMAALAHGMPIVTTTPRTEMVDASQMSLHKFLPKLRDGENCLLVPPDDAQALANAIEHGAASPELRAKISAGARELSNAFTWDKIAQQHLELYRQMGV
jgi:glycosyltransferase involved in cell wall biosynthesis